MISAAEWREIHALVERATTIILSGQTAETEIDGKVGTESIDSLYPGMPTIGPRPVAHPYGLVSRAPAGTVQVTARQGEHPANRLVLLHRDANRPSVADGDVWLYDNHGNQVKLISGKVVVKSSAIELGEGATKGVARVQDAVGASSLMATFLSQVATGLNTLAPGAVTPVPPGSAIGAIVQGSSKVTAVD